MRKKLVASRTAGSTFQAEETIGAKASGKLSWSVSEKKKKICMVKAQWVEVEVRWDDLRLVGKGQIRQGLGSHSKFGFYSFFFFFFCFLGPPVLHTEAEQCQIGAASATYSTVLDNAWSLTHWMNPGIEPTYSWILLGFITPEPQQKLLDFILSVTGQEHKKETQWRQFHNSPGQRWWSFWPV